VLNKQREVIYGIRNGALHADRPKDIIFEHDRGRARSTASTIAGFGDKGGASQTASRASSAG
jgi:preprotein translocase subunit SecA